MDFQVKCKLEKDCVSKKTGGKYDRVIINFGDFSKIVVLSTLELKNLEEKLGIKHE